MAHNYKNSSGLALYQLVMAGQMWYHGTVGLIVIVGHKHLHRHTLLRVARLVANLEVLGHAKLARDVLQCYMHMRTLGNSRWKKNKQA